MIELGVRAILKKNNKVLLVKNHHGIHKDKWVLPGGKVEFKEPSKDAIQREIREELGLEFEPKFLAYHEDRESSESVYYITLFFTGAFTGEIKEQNSEILEYRFFSEEEVKNSGEIGLGHKEVILRNNDIFSF
jgi:8-oxo-dGTP diphosphatase